MEAEIGVIGGSGIYEIPNAKVLGEKAIETPFGNPSDTITIAEIAGRSVAFLPRHGRGHRLLPTEVPVQANIWAMKKLGVNSILAISAVGSLKEEFAPRDFVIPDQIIDRTRSRENSFFGDGVVGHVSFADPFCPELRRCILKGLGTSTPVHDGATLLVMEGPLFSTRAESNLYRSWGCGIIGMTALPEAKLAREAEIAYAMIGMVTDYDCWKEDEADVDITTLLGHMKHNVETVKKSLPSLIGAIPQNFKSPAHEAAKFAVMTNTAMIPEKTKKRLELLYGKYWT